MGNIDDFRAKQQELLNTEQQLKDTKAELDDKTNALENAKLKNEDEKTELIEQLLSEIDALKQNAQNYEQQIASINEELNTLRGNFNAAEQTTPQEDTPKQTIPQENPTQQTIPQKSPIEQTVPQKTTSEQTISQKTTIEETNYQNASTQQTISQATPTEQIVPQVASTEQLIDRIDISNPTGFLAALNELLNEIENTKTGISKRKISKSGKETMENAKTKLKQYKDKIKGKKSELERQIKKGGNPEILESDVNRVKRLYSEIGEVKKSVNAGQRGELSNQGAFLYNSPENAKKSNKKQEHLNQFEIKLKEEVKDGAILNIFGKQEQTAIDFYRRIAEGHYTQSDYTLYTINAQIFDPSFQRCGIAIPTDPKLIQGQNGRIETVPTRKSVDYSNLDRGETFEQGGIAGRVDKALSNCNNLTPGQRNTWKSIAILGGYAAGIYGLFKFFTNKKMGFWGKALTTGGVILGSQILTGENPIALFQKLLTGGFSKDYLESTFGNAFGDAVDGVQNSGIEGADSLSGAMYSLMIFNQTTKVGEVRALSTKFKDNPQEWSQFRGEAITKLSRYGKTSVEKFSAVFSENFDEQKRNNWLTSIGIHEGISDDKLVYELAGNKTMNTVIINKYFSDNGLKLTDNKVKKEEFEQYKKSCNDNNKAIDISVFNAHPERFTTDKDATFTDRPKDIENREKLGRQIDQLSLDDQKKAELKKAAERFYDERSIENKPNLNDFNLEIEDGFLILTSHGGYKSKIDIEKNQLVGFGNGINFYNLSDLLNVADLTNKILESQKGKSPTELPAFEYKLGKKGRGIYFNDASTRSFDFDTRVLSGGWGGKMGEIEALPKNPKEYADYLSKSWLEQSKIDINGTLYPTVKKLSDTGIIFVNEQEVKDLETWLKGIKENLKFSVSNANPFSLSGKLKFKAVNGDTQEFPESISEKFPTITREQNKANFLKFMNNPNNKMWGSAIN